MIETVVFAATSGFECWVDRMILPNRSYTKIFLFSCPGLDGQQEQTTTGTHFCCHRMAANNAQSVAILEALSQELAALNYLSPVPTMPAEADKAKEGVARVGME